MAYNWQTEYHRYRRYFADIGQLYKNKKTRVYTEIVFSLITISFFLFFAIKPTLTTIASLMKNIKDQETVTEQLQSKIRALITAQAEYNLIKDDLPLVDESLPQETQVSLLVRQLEALARQTGVEVEAIKFEQVYLRGAPPSTTDTPQSLNFSFVASGQYQNLKAFLQSCSSLRRIIIVESFSFNSRKTQTEDQLLTLSLNGKAYFLKEK